MKSYNEIIEANSNKILKKNNNLKKKKIKFLLNFNTFQLEAYVQYYLKKKLIQAVLPKSEFDQIFQELNVIKKKDNIDMLVIGNEFNLIYDINNFSIKNFAKQIFTQIELLKKLKNKFPKTEVIIFNIPEVYYQNFPNQKKQENKNIINKLNNELKVSCEASNIYLLDYNYLITIVGQKNFYSFKNYYSSKSLLSDEGCNIIASEISKIVRSVTFPRKKCLVLDLDNTLWGGILGEEGPEGIKISNSFIGEKYLQFQKYIKSLSDNGVILGILSKNNFLDVKKCFSQNDNLFLKLSDFSSIRINWEPKFKNINEIASELNIHKNSIVFFDDSKFERDQMKKFNPEINVIDVPFSVENYIDSIEETAFFYSNKKFISEDYKKKYQYDLVNKVKSYKLKFKDTDTMDYLKSLKMKITLSKINEKNFSRCVQMLNKTNQFNFTTTRYTESTFENYLKKNKIISLVVKLEDKFGNHGITGLITANIQKNKCIIDNFLLSCRILGRNVEKIIIEELIRKLKNLKVKNLIGIYKKNKKNIQCANFYKNNGFSAISKNEFLLNLQSYHLVNKKIILVKYE
jgi:FkbH-like protein